MVLPWVADETDETLFLGFVVCAGAGAAGYAISDWLPDASLRGVSHRAGLGRNRRRRLPLFRIRDRAPEGDRAGARCCASRGGPRGGTRAKFRAETAAAVLAHQCGGAGLR